MCDQLFDRLTCLNSFCDSVCLNHDLFPPIYRSIDVNIFPFWKAPFRAPCRVLFLTPHHVPSVFEEFPFGSLSVQESFVHLPVCPTDLHVHEDHEAPPEPPHQEHGDVHAVDEEVIEEGEIQALVAQQQQDDGELVLQPQEDAHAHILQAEEGRQRHPQERREQAAAKVEQETDKAVHPAGLQVQVEVVVF